MATQPSLRDKRIIVSGLTPAISAQDIRLRFAPFGTVKAVDGVGLLDGNGDPRKFAFVTVELNEKELSTCMSRLNGTKWKGAKLRIGEARQDFRANKLNLLDNARMAPNLPEKGEKNSFSNTIKGRHAADMSLTTLENVDRRKVRAVPRRMVQREAYHVPQHWKRTPLGHIVRPVRMRPSRPIPSLPSTARSASKSTSARTPARIKSSKVLRRAKLTVIDPTKYGSTHLTVATRMFGTVAQPRHDGNDLGPMRVGDEGEPVIEHDKDEVRHTNQESEEPSLNSGSEVDVPQIGFRRNYLSDIVNSEQSPPLSPATNDEGSRNVQEEKKRDLDILASVLGNQDALTWEPDSDLEQLAWENSDKRRKELEVEADGDDSNTEAEAVQLEHALQNLGYDPVKTAPLKEMFAPRPDESGFSLFDNIGDLDVELEEPDVELNPQDITWRGVAGHSEALHHSRPEFVPDIVPDHATPFFFPLPRDERGVLDRSFGSPSYRNSSNLFRDVFDGGVANSVDSGGFWRVETQSREEIRKYWDETKGELTREYKTRHRDAQRRLKPLKVTRANPES
ncbi:hypothetical protein FS837_012011 [Tulasnella sp. UAMH 9824]|nr:hypothetical protein FS837_012011 [Tulasnella sp. UAMH 9824]